MRKESFCLQTEATKSYSGIQLKVYKCLKMQKLTGLYSTLMPGRHIALLVNQVIFGALFELVITHIFHRKKLDDIGAENLSKIIANVQKS